jgi:hypothetical protein
MAHFLSRLMERRVSARTRRHGRGQQPVWLGLEVYHHPWPPRAEERGLNTPGTHLHTLLVYSPATGLALAGIANSDLGSAAAGWDSIVENAYDASLQ